jgi:hypothetical protein
MEAYHDNRYLISVRISGWPHQAGVADGGRGVGASFQHPSGASNGRTAKSHLCHGLEGIRVANTSGTLLRPFSDVLVGLLDAVLTGKPSGCGREPWEASAQ